MNINLSINLVLSISLLLLSCLVHGAEVEFKLKDVEKLSSLEENTSLIEPFDHKENPDFKKVFEIYLYAHKRMMDFDYVVGVPGAEPTSNDLGSLKELKDLRDHYQESGKILDVYSSPVYQDLIRLKVISENLEEKISQLYFDSLKNLFKLKLTEIKYKEFGKVFTKDEKLELIHTQKQLLKLKAAFIPRSLTDEQLIILENLYGKRFELAEKLSAPAIITPKTSRKAVRKRDRIISEIDKISKDLNLRPNEIRSVGQQFIEFLNKEAEELTAPNSRALSVLGDINRKTVVIQDSLSKLSQEKINSIQVDLKNMKLEKFKFQGRNPDSNFYEPSVGVKGNMFGLRFPIGAFALTFDDGPHELFTRPVVDYLKEKNIQATWFLVANEASLNPDIGDYIIGSGMELAAHSLSHLNMLDPDIDEREKKKEVYVGVSTLESLFDRQISYYRFPYGNGLRNDKYRSWLVDKNLIHVHWNVDSLDWKDSNPKSILARVKAQMKRQKRGVLLFHDTGPAVIEVVKRLVEENPLAARYCSVGNVLKEMETGIPCDQKPNQEIDISESVMMELEYLCNMFRRRASRIQRTAEVILNGDYKNSSNQCVSASVWHEYSTPKSDERLIEKMKMLNKKFLRIQVEGSRLKVSRSVERILQEVFQGEYYGEDKYCSFQFRPEGSEEKMTLSRIYKSIKSHKLSFNPHDNIFLRWGIQNGQASTCTIDKNSGYYGYQFE